MENSREREVGVDTMGRQVTVRWITKGILHLLFPPKCALCGCIIREKDKLLCQECRRKLPYATGAKLLWERDLRLTCSAPFYYEGNLRKAFLRYKFQGKDFYAELFGEFVAEAAGVQLEGGYDLVTWAPLSKRRLRERGYDQAKLLAEIVADKWHLPLVQTLVKQKNTKPQSGLNDAAARAENARGAYAPACSLNLEGKRVLLVDDILTTGSTMKECARVLLNCGAEVVDCAVLAGHRPKLDGKGWKSPR